MSEHPVGRSGERGREGRGAGRLPADAVAEPRTVRGAGADYRTLFDQSEIPVALVSAVGTPRLVAASRGFLDTFDLRRPVVIGRTLGEVFGSADNTGLAMAIRRCLATSETIHATVELQNGSNHIVVGIAAHPTGARGFSGHVLLEAEARGHTIFSQIQRFSSLVAKEEDASEPMTYIFDAKRQRLRFTEGALARRMGLHGAITSRDALERVHPDDLELHASHRAARDALPDDKFVSSTLRLRDAHGDWRLISLRSRVLRRDRDGSVRLMLGNAVDITDYAAAAVEATELSVLRAEEHERARIGRELHDSAAQYLVATSLGLSAALRTEGLSDSLHARLKEVQSSLETAQAEIRAFAYFLHPPELQALGLKKTVVKFCAGFARCTGLAIQVAADDVPEDLSTDAEHALFRVCQEALMNVYRHASAHKVTVGLQRKDGYLILEVRDDGVGVDGADRFEHGGMGVAGMRARMHSVSGGLRLDYAGPGLGVVARVPLPA